MLLNRDLEFFLQGNLTFVFSSTTLSPSAETHRTALTAFFPDFQKKKEKEKKQTVLCQQHQTATHLPFPRAITLSVDEVHGQ